MEFKRKGQKLSKPRHRHVERNSASKYRKNISNEKKADTELKEAPASTPITYLSVPCGSTTEHKDPKLVGHLTKLHEWLIEHKGESRHCLQIPAKELDLLLAEFIMSVRTAWGREFCAVTLRLIGNNITRYLAENSHPLGGQAKEFMLFRQVMRQKVRDLLEEQKNFIHRITDTAGTSQEKTTEKGTAFIENTVTNPCKEFATTLTTRASTSVNRQAAWIQYVLRYTITRYFGLRKKEELHSLCWGDFYLDANDNGIESLKSLKRRDNGKPNPGCSPLCLTGKNDRCAVCLYREFASHRPSSTLQSKSPFFLEVIPYDLLQPGSDVWYYPVGLCQDFLTLDAMLMDASCGNASTLDRVPYRRGKKMSTSTQMPQGIL